MLKREDLKRGDRVFYHGMYGLKLKATVGVRFDNKCEIHVDGFGFSQPTEYHHIELMPICRTEIYKALTEGEWSL